MRYFFYFGAAVTCEFPIQGINKLYLIFSYEAINEILSRYDEKASHYYIMVAEKASRLKLPVALAVSLSLATPFEM